MHLPNTQPGNDNQKDHAEPNWTRLARREGFVRSLCDSLANDVDSCFFLGQVVTDDDKGLLTRSSRTAPCQDPTTHQLRSRNAFGYRAECDFEVSWAYGGSLRTKATKQPRGKGNSSGLAATIREQPS